MWTKTIAQVPVAVFAIAAIYLAAAAIGNAIGGGDGVLVAVVVASIPIWGWITLTRRHLRR